MKSFRLTIAMLVALYLKSGECRPPVSSGVLLQFFGAIKTTTGIFPDPKSKGNNTLYIVNEAFDQCMQIVADDVGSGQVVTHGACAFGLQPYKNQAFFLMHVGEGHITFSKDGIMGIGAGYDSGSAVFTGDWLRSPSHYFAMINYDESVTFVNRDSASCLAAKQPNLITVDTCVHTDAFQRWRVCERTGSRCWPSARPTRQQPQPTRQDYYPAS